MLPAICTLFLFNKTNSIFSHNKSAYTSISAKQTGRYTDGALRIEMCAPLANTRRAKSIARIQMKLMLFVGQLTSQQARPGQNKI
jgi:hypothetical protein